MRRFISIAVCLTLLACTVSDTPPVEVPEEWTAWQKDSLAGYIDDDLAVLKAADYRYIVDGSKVFLVNNDDEFSLKSTEPQAYQWAISYNEGQLTAVSQADDWKEVYKQLPSDPIPLSDSQRLRFNIENISHSEKRVRAILYDDQASALTDFPGLSYFPYNATGIISARFKADPAMPQIVLDTERGLTKAFYRAGYAVFELEGKSYQMPLYTGSSEPKSITSFFTGFVDATTGTESYGTGRYVPVADFGEFPPKTITIDFNYSYNPYCAWSDAYNCPVIDFEIDAPMRYGEAYKLKE